MLFQAPSAEEAQRFLQENELDALEISLPIVPDGIPARVRRKIEACGESLPGKVQLHEVLPLVLAHREGAFRDRLLKRLKEDILVARRAGAGVITLHTTCTRTRRPLRNDWRLDRTRWMARALDLDVTSSYTESVEVLIQTLRELHHLAEPSRGKRVTLAVENNFRDTRYFGRRIDSIGDVMAILDRVALPCVQMCFDIFKAHSTEKSIPDAVKLAGNLIANMHASDAQPAETAFFRERAPVGEGAVRWEEVTAAISEIHYRGAIILEMMPSAEDVRTSARRLRKMLIDRGSKG